VSAANGPLCYKVTSWLQGELGMFEASITVIGLVVSMVLAGRIAASRGRSMRAWIWLAAVFGPLATMAAWALPVKRAPSPAGANGN
jgi:hypothetical protein